MKIGHLALIFVSITLVYSKKKFNPKSLLGCGQVESHRIINGHISTANKYPWHVGLFGKVGKTFTFFCGGSLISDKHVLTAAHCFDEVPSFVQIYIGTGLFNLSEANPDVNLIKVSRKIKHEKYSKEDNFLNDIAILELSKSVKLSTKVSAICLPSTQDTKLVFNKSLQVVGWGSTKQVVSPDAISNTLMELDVKIVNYFNETLCQSMDELKYCGYDFSEKHSNLCVGDSGGSLMHFMNGKWYAFGIVSFGNVEFIEKRSTLKCQNEMPTYYSIVPNYIDWINEKIGNNKKKNKN